MGPDLTDVPMFISGKHFCIFDPHKTHRPLGPHGQRVGGAKIDLTTRSEAGGRTFCEVFPGQMAPFAGLPFGWSVDGSGCGSWESGTEGTIFRLPLRSKAQGSASKIKPGLSAVYSPERALGDIFAPFIEGLSTRILFLKHVEVIEYAAAARTRARTPPVPAPTGHGLAQALALARCGASSNAESARGAGGVE
jgi:sacsin